MQSAALPAPPYPLSPGTDVRPGALTAATGVDPRQWSENFPVALRVLPADVRRHLERVYSVARHIDDLGDEVAGDRRAALLAYRADLGELFAGRAPREPTLRALASTVRACGLAEQPFQDLVEANLVDQRVSGYRTYQDLLGYCALSADPVGRIVLTVFGQSTPERVAASDRVCSALQVLEHCQDVSEDALAGRLYLPAELLTRAGVPADGVLLLRHRQAVQGVIADLVLRSREGLRQGRWLVGQLHGWARIAVAGFVAGGLATADAVDRSGADTIGYDVRPRRADVMRHLAVLLAGAPLWSRSPLPAAAAQSGAAA